MTNLRSITNDFALYAENENLKKRLAAYERKIKRIKQLLSDLSCYVEACEDVSIGQYECSREYRALWKELEDKL